MTDTATTTIMPVVVLQTERLTLRAFTETDIDDVFHGSAHPAVQAWVPIPAPGVPCTRAVAEEWCLRRAPELRVSGDGQNWCAVETATGGFVGAFGLNRTNWAARITEVGYWVDPRAHGRGFAPEAVTAIARWTLEDQGFERLELKAATANAASRRVAEKVGFVYEGTERNGMPLHDRRTDLAVYSLIGTDLADWRR